LFEPTDDDDPYKALDATDSHGDAAAVDGIFARRLAEHVFLFEALLVAVHLVVHEPRTHAPPLDGPPLSRHPDVIVGLDPRPRDGVEEEVVAAGQGDVDDGRELRQGTEPVAQRQAYLEGVVGGEVRQDQPFFLLGDLREL